MDILLDEAIERFTAISVDLDYPTPRPVRRPAEVEDELEAVNRHLAPLAIPAELATFWTGWDPCSFAVLTAAGGMLHTPATAAHHRELDAHRDRPAILLPIGRTDDGELVVELDAPDHPGSRLYRIGPAGRISLVGAGVADLLDLYASWIDRRHEDGRDPARELHVTPDTLDRVLDEAVERYRHQHVDANRGRWPRHWLLAQGFDESFLAPRGATHTTVEFDTARRIAWPVTAVLQGVWTVRWATPAGTLGILADDHGAVELLNPTGIPDAGQGPDDRCEIEVVGIAPAADNPDPRPTAGLLIPQAMPAQIDQMAGLLEEMQSAMDLLGSSVVATAIRPL